MLTLSVTRAGTQLATADPGISYTAGACGAPEPRFCL
ncbi:hypothetical protein FRAHR75_640009 [Frankia sp. Hr75.2]|nr:hypothetical protein FRAHR75_640009 [Frankia sp. Hr75.2]